MIGFLLLLSELRIPDLDYKSYFLEQYIRNKTIVYKLGGNGPKYYDCGGVVTEAYRKIGYQNSKISSHMNSSCRITLQKAKKGDILINSNEGQRHVALITQNLGRKVMILDYVEKYRVSSYRIHSAYKGVYALSKDCLINSK